MIKLADLEKKFSDAEYWRYKANFVWRMYLNNLKMVRSLRKENRLLRDLLMDYVEEE